MKGNDMPPVADFKTIRVRKAEGICRIVLTRPKHNVLNIEMMKELVSGLEALGGDDSSKCIVLLGEGRSWCAGVDVGEHKPEIVEEMIGAFNRIFETLHGIEIPVIAAVKGAALGGGMELAVACDIVIAAKSAIFGQPEIRLGFFPPYAAVRLTELIGSAKTIEICTTGKIYSADEAQKYGFVGTVVEDEVFDSALEKIVQEIAAASPLILRLNKRAVKENQGKGFASALKGVTDLFLNTLMKTEDTREGIASFYEKRKPVWKNR